MTTAPGMPRADGTYAPGRPTVVVYGPGVPSVVQLLNLADRAERQVLSPAEADRLRQGLAWMAAREARVDRLAAALESSPDGLMSRQTAAYKIRSALTGRRVRRPSGSGGSPADAPGSTQGMRLAASGGSGGGIPAGDAPGASEGRSTASARTAGRAPASDAPSRPLAAP